MDYIRYKYCSCCDTRLDKVPKGGVSHVKDAELVNALNVYKTIILPKKNKITNNIPVKINDQVCGGCRSYANKYAFIVYIVYI